MFKLMLIATLTFSFALPAAAQTGAVVAGKSPGAAGIAQTVKVSATITAIDKATRSVTMKGPKGREVTIVAGPEVRNFAQLKVGDQVEAQYVESLAIELKKGGGLPVGATEQAAAMRAKDISSYPLASKPMEYVRAGSPLTSPSIPATVELSVPPLRKVPTAPPVAASRTLFRRRARNDSLSSANGGRSSST